MNRGQHVLHPPMSNTVIKEQDHPRKMILFPEDGEQDDNGKSDGEGCMNVLTVPSQVD